MTKQYIYEIINNLNGKTYVGQRKCHCEIDKDPYMGSGINITRAINKYGKENFVKVILEDLSNSTQEELNEKEVLWIKKRKEEGKAQYNIAGGGQGCSSPFEYKTEEEKQKIYKKSAESRKGKPSGTFGKTWKAKSIPIPHSNAREVLGQNVVIMEIGQEFQSYGECAEFLGVLDKKGVERCCKGQQQTAGGYHICFKEKYDKSNNPWIGKPRGKTSQRAGKNQVVSEKTLEHIKAFNATLAQPIRCITNNTIYSSIGEAAEKLNLRKNSIVASLNGRQKSTGGYFFEKVNQEKEMNPAIIILENEKTFMTVPECAKYIGCYPSTVQKCLAGYAKQCKGFHVSYYKDYNKEDNPWIGKERYSEQKSRGLPKRVVCLDTEQVWESARQAARELNLISSSITSVCIGTRKSTGGLHFRYIDE